MRRDCFTVNLFRSGQKAEADEDGHGDDRGRGRRHDDDEGDGRDRAVHHTRVPGHQAGADHRPVPVAVQDDGDEADAQEGDQVGVAALALRRAPGPGADDGWRRPVPRVAVLVHGAAHGAAAAAAAASAGRPVRAAAAAAVHALRRLWRHGRRR